MASSRFPLSDKENWKSALQNKSLSNVQPTSIIFKGIPKLLCFSRSIFSEWIVYSLVYHSIGAIITLYLVLPIDLLSALFSGGYELSRFIRFHVFLFFFPTGGFAFEAFPLGTRILLIGLWTLTVRPSLALAGWIVSKRLPAYTLPVEKFPPIRWSFEYLCCVANQRHFFIPDPEFYVRQAIRLINPQVSSNSYHLGTISPDEHDELRDFSRIYRTVMKQSFEGPWREVPLPAIKIGEGVHLVCAARILSHANEGIPSSRSLGFNIRWETPFFWRMYVFVLFYWVYRVHGEISALVWPYTEDGTSCVEEWYEKYAVLTSRV